MNNKDNSSTPFVTFLIGVVAGAGIMFLSSEDNRRKLNRNIQKLKIKIEEEKDKMKRHAEKVQPPLDV